MHIQPISENQREAFNNVVTHPLQSYEWGEFREKTGIKVIRRGFFEGGKLISGFQLTIHKVPKTKYTIGYLPKGNLPTTELLEELQKIGKEEKCIFIQLEPNITKKENPQFSISHFKFPTRPSAKPLFTKYTFQLDLTKPEDELLQHMHQKTRYNIRVAQRHGVKIKEDDSDKAFEIYWRLTEETTKRQNFYAHTKIYHKLMWETLASKREDPQSHEQLQAHLLLATYQAEHEEKTLAAWVLLTFHDHLYYPYGASSSEHKNVMASNLMMWEAIRFGKARGLKVFDMWGSLGENPDPKDPWFGFHRLKQGYNPQLVEFIGSFDLVINPALYELYKGANLLRWLYLRIKKVNI